MNVAVIFFAIFICGSHGSVEEALVGHLQPLGAQRPPSVQIDEFEEGEFPTPKEFFDNYMKYTKAAIFRGAMTGTPAFTLWTDEYLKSNYPDLELRMEGKKEKGSAGIPIGEKYVGRDTIKHFVDTYHNNGSNQYIVSELPTPMYHEFHVIPTMAACGPMKERFVEIDIWWSGGNSRSVIHKDAYNQINCLLNGTKTWKLFEYKYEKYIHKHWEPAGAIGGFSDVNVDAVDLNKTPNITKIPWSNFTIHAGDCLYLPKSYYHQVVSHGTHNLAVSILFGRFDGENEADFSDCTDKTDYKKLTPLSEIEVDLMYSGKGPLTMGQTDVHSHRTILMKNVQEIETNGIDFTFEIFEQQDIYEGAREAFDLLDLNKDGKLTTEEIKQCTRDQIRQYGKLTEPYEPSNNKEFEYSLISYDQVLNVIKHVKERVKVLKKSLWMKLYQKYLKGTKEAANEIFTKMAGSEEVESIEMKNIKRDDITRALENWIKYFSTNYAMYGSVKQANREMGFSDEEDDEVYFDGEDEEGDEDDSGNMEQEEDDEQTMNAKTEL